MTPKSMSRCTRWCMAARDTPHSAATSLKGIRAFCEIISRIFWSNSSIFPITCGCLINLSWQIPGKYSNILIQNAVLPQERFWAYMVTAWYRVETAGIASWNAALSCYGKRPQAIWKPAAFGIGTAFFCRATPLECPTRAMGAVRFRQKKIRMGIVLWGAV